MCIYSPEHQEGSFGIGVYDYFKVLAERLNIEHVDHNLRTNRYKTPRENRNPVKKFYDITHEI